MLVALLGVTVCDPTVFGTGKALDKYCHNRSNKND